MFKDPQYDVVTEVSYEERASSYSRDLTADSIIEADEADVIDKTLRRFKGLLQYGVELNQFYFFTLRLRER